jgi:hypothetical protein
MDFHTEYAPDYVVRCVQALQRTGAQNAGGPARTRAEGPLAAAIAAAYHSPFACGGARFHDVSYEGWVDTVTYGCWEKSYLERLGLFDESLVRNQDDELNLRIVRSGGRIWQDPKIVSWYHPRGSLRSLFRQYFQYGFWKVAVIRKHRIPASWRHLVPALFVSSVAAVPLAAAFDQRFWVLWLFEIALYGAACLGVSALTAARAGLRLFPLLPAVFATYHLAYGLGFVAGLLSGSKQPALVTEITR